MCFRNVYDKQPNKFQSIVGIPLKLHFENSDISLDDVASIIIPETPSFKI